jgi:hypothetical protein
MKLIWSIHILLTSMQIMLAGGQIFYLEPPFGVLQVIDDKVSIILCFTPTHAGGLL